MSDRFTELARALVAAKVRFLVIGVWGANYYTSGALFVTHDQDLFVPRDAGNLLVAWQVCAQFGLQLTANSEPLDQPRDQGLADAVVRSSSLTTASDDDVLRVDLSLVMGEFAFDDVFARCVIFVVDGAAIPVASLRDILAAKRSANRPKDRLFLATHEAELRRLLQG